MEKDNLNIELLNDLANLKVKNSNRLNKAKRRFANKYKIGMISNADLLRLYKKQLKKKLLKPDQSLENFLQKRKIRTLSGVAPIAVLTKHYPCPGKCAYCPDEKGMPKSYLSNEPAVMRAVMTKFDPHTQVKVRIRALTDNGHSTDKIELIIMGGTWSYFPRQYQNWFVKRCFDACNGRNAKNLDQAQKWNEKAKHRIVAMTLETRPDYIDEEEVRYWRKLGATKVELGVQSLSDKVLSQNKRGHGTKATIQATKLFKQAGFKIAYHMMPNLPGSTPANDFKDFKTLFDRPEYQPDFLKIYPTVVTKNSLLFKWWQQGKYKPYSDKKLFALLLKIKQIIPDRVRIIRLIRDIPLESIEAGNLISNLRESLQKELQRLDKKCKCIRCREARADLVGINQTKLYTTKYKASEATEYFFQYTSKDKQKLFAFLRMRLPEKDEKNFIPEIQNCAMMREVHTYGKLVPIAKTKGSKKEIQHQGFGTRLTHEAEDIARKNGFTKMAVISGVGVRGFYRKLGYKLIGTYMVKDL